MKQFFKTLSIMMRKAFMRIFPFLFAAQVMAQQPDDKHVQWQPNSSKFRQTQSWGSSLTPKQKKKRKASKMAKRSRRINYSVNRKK